MSPVPQHPLSATSKPKPYHATNTMRNEIDMRKIH
jgi:hypothetical protein